MVKPVPARIPPTGSGAWLARRSDGHRLHAGVDLLGPGGREVVAPESGVVRVVFTSSRPVDPRRSSPPGWAGYGPKGVLMHGDSGAWHLLAHLGSVEVSPSSVLTEGQRVGTISGELSTPHCHWEVRAQAQPTGGAAIVELCADPAAWLEGRWVPWDGRCPALPTDDQRTPRACRPGWRGPAPRPFPRPARVHRPGPLFELERPEGEGGSHGSR